MNFSVLNGMFSSVGNLIDKLSTNSKEKEDIKKEINATIMNHLNEFVNAEKEIILAEAKGNWLQRSWRPIVMLAYSSIVIIGIFTEIPILKNDSPFWDILQLGLGGYVIGRSAEKITTTIGKRLFK